MLTPIDHRVRLQIEAMIAADRRRANVLAAVLVAATLALLSAAGIATLAGVHLDRPGVTEF